MRASSIDRTDLDRMRVQMDLHDATLRARFNYRNQAVENLLTRIEDCVSLVKDKNYPLEEALRMIELQCRRVRLIEEELSK